MDDIAETLRREITLDGYRGTKLGRLWVYVEQAQRQLLEKNSLDSSSVEVDDAMKSYLWPQIIRLKNMVFFEDKVVIYDSVDLGNSANTMLPTLTLAQVEQQYPQLTVRGSSGAINKELFGREEGSRKVLASEKAFEIMQLLAQSRNMGVTQFKLGKDVNVEPKSVFHYVKILDAEGLIVKLATYQNGTHTNLVMLRRFSNDLSDTKAVLNFIKDSGEGEQALGAVDSLVRYGLRQKISDALEKSEGGVMVETDLIDALQLDLWNLSQRKYFHRVVRNLIDGGVLERVRVQVKDIVPSGGRPLREAVDSEEPDSAEEESASGAKEKQLKRKMGKARAGQTKRLRTNKPRPKGPGHREGHSYRRCLRLLTPYVSNQVRRDKMGIPRRARDGQDDAVPEVDEDEDEDDVDVDADDDDDDGGANGIPDIEAIKEKEDLRYLLSKDEVQIGLLATLPLDAQVFRLIALSGAHGTVINAMLFLLGQVSYKMIVRVLGRLEKTPVHNSNRMLPGMIMDAVDASENESEFLVTSVNEFLGREKRKRYYANPLAWAAIASLTVDHLATHGIRANNRPDEAINQPLIRMQFRSELEPTDATNGNVSAAPETEPEADADAEPDADAEIAAEAARALESDYGSIADIIREAHERREPVNTIIRERVILRMVERECVFLCGQNSVSRCNQAMRAYIVAHKGSYGITPAMLSSAQNHAMDKRTFMRTLAGMAALDKLFIQVVDSMPLPSSANQSREVYIVIARSIDPRGQLVESFMNELRERRKIHSVSKMTVLPLVDLGVDVPRTQRAAQIDAQIKENERRRHIGHGSSMLTKGRTKMQHIFAHTESNGDSTWKRVSKMLEHQLRRIGRMIDLHTFLASKLPKLVDDKRVFKNLAFQTTFLFSALPLGLYLRLCGGILHFPAARHYIRHGHFSEDIDTDEEDDFDRYPTSPIEEIEKRMDTPIMDLPKPLLNRFYSRLTKARPHLQQLVHSLCVMRLLRPVQAVADIVDMPSADSKDLQTLPDNLRFLNYGYQLVGHARLLSRASICNPDGPLTFHDDRVFNILEGDEVYTFWNAVENMHRNAEPKLPRASPLYGIDQFSYWTRQMSLAPEQTAQLSSFVGDTSHETPLDEPERLHEAAQAAGVSVELARCYYRNVYLTIGRYENRRDKERKRHTFISQKIKRAKEAAAAAESAGQSMELTRRCRRRPWSESDSTIVALAYSVLRNHACMHKHPFLLHGLGTLFPSRVHTNKPGEGVRQRWVRMRRQPGFRAMSDTLTVLWKYVLDDAVTAEELVDTPDIADLDLRSMINHFRAVLRESTIDVLLDRYAERIAEDMPDGWEDLVRGSSLASVISVGKDEIPEPSKEALAKDAAERKPPSSSASRRIVHDFRHRLPSTMFGHEAKYGVVVQNEQRARGSKGMLLTDFKEDAYREGMFLHARRSLAYDAMLTAHVSYQNMGDNSCQVVTMLKGSEDREPEIVSDAAASMAYPDAMSAFYPVQRTFDASDLARQIQALAIGRPVAVSEKKTEKKAEGGAEVAVDVVQSPAESMDVDGAAAEPTNDADGASDFESQPTCIKTDERYAQVATMQAMFVNLTLTPESQYDVATGHGLLTQNESAARQAMDALGKNSIINRLSSMASTIGLEGPADPEVSQSETRATVVVHETTGTTRIVAKGIAHGTGDDEDNAMDVVDETGERRVPGRGISIGDKFMCAIMSTLPSGYVRDPMWAPVPANTPIDRRLGSGEFAHMCRQIASSKLWLRPAYPTDLQSRSVSGLAGFRQQESGNMVEVLIKVLSDQSAVPGGASGDIEGTREVVRGHALELTELSGSSLDTALRIVTGTVGLLGALGASPHELCALFSRHITSLNGISLEIHTVLCSILPTTYLLRLLSMDRKLMVVGSNDLRYVSVEAFKAHWSLRIPDSADLLPPYIGYNLSGSAINSEYILGMFKSLLGHVFDNPGVSIVVLMRRYYAPYISKFEVMRYLRVLVDLGILREEWDAVLGGGTTTYYLDDVSVDTQNVWGESSSSSSSSKRVNHVV
ncbi:hypothetical protein LPJ66_002949 [Kickxella alabastrina]|uniref:Uncharacterized protein n=1 Tax=Kickxella alabastrina TaxID=61397 RepID=A0ACC1INP2_9FUNG|nr:hypothetical protein LPJ66_002949 [Kickxella alabastrina]